MNGTTPTGRYPLRRYPPPPRRETDHHLGLTTRGDTIEHTSHPPAARTRQGRGDGRPNTNRVDRVTWNPTTGCDRTSPGLRQLLRPDAGEAAQGDGHRQVPERRRPRTSGPGFGLTLHHDTLDQPRRWRQPRTVFVNSMSDLFHPDVPVDYIRDVFDVIADTPQHQYQVLTKRSKRLAAIRRPARLAGQPLDGRQRRERPLPLPSRPPAPGPRHGQFLVGASRCSVRSATSTWTASTGSSPAASPGPCAGRWMSLGHRPPRPVPPGVPFFFKQWGGRTPEVGRPDARRSDLGRASRTCPSADPPMIGVSDPLPRNRVRRHMVRVARTTTAALGPAPSPPRPPKRSPLMRG